MVEFIILDKIIKVKIHGKNRDKYEKIIGRKLANGENIDIPQKYVLEGTRVIVECMCDHCGKVFQKQRSDIKGDTTLCGKDCRNEWLKRHNPNPSKEKVKVNCNICNEKIYINESKYKKQKYFLCSRECYKAHRSKNYKGENTYNYNSFVIPCKMCERDVKATPYDIESRRFLFCSPECYWKHRSEYYIEHYYNSSMNDTRLETNPEKLVREWLEDNSIQFEQEGFLRKYYLDFYLTEYKAVIEVYGDYWHVNPTIYGDEPHLKPLTHQQLGTREYDIARNNEIRQYLPLFVIWESEVKDDIDFYMRKIMNKIINRESVTTERLTPTKLG